MGKEAIKGAFLKLLVHLIPLSMSVEVFEMDGLVAIVGHDPQLMQWRFLDYCYGHAQ